MLLSDKIDLEYNQIRLDILRAEDSKKLQKAIKESIRKFEKDYGVKIMVSRLWDFYDLIINKKTN